MKGKCKAPVGSGRAYQGNKSAQPRGPPGILYHGTCERYLRDQMKRHACYEHDNGRPVYLAEDPLEAICYSMKRSIQQHQKPLILLVETEIKAQHEPFVLVTSGTWKTARLSRVTFVEYRPGVDANGKIAVEELQKIADLSRRILENSARTSA